MMGRGCAHFKPWWAYIGTSKRKRKTSRKINLKDVQPMTDADWKAILFIMAVIYFILLCLKTSNH